MLSLYFIFFQFATLIFSVILHEIAHGYMAERLGDPTARLAGRLTLNPIRHIDPFGSVVLPLLLFVSGSPVVLGWAKPVPYNPANLYKDYQYGSLKVGLAGPLTNILLFLVFAMFARAGAEAVSLPLIGLFGYIALMNIHLAVFNLLPIPPLDGSKLLTLILPARFAHSLEYVGVGGILIVFILLQFFSGVILSVALGIFRVVAGDEVLGAVFGVLRFFSGSQ